MVKEIQQEQIAPDPHQELSEIGTLEEDHLEEDPLEEHQEEIRQEEVHQEETCHEEVRQPEGTQTMMIAKGTELIPERSAATSIYSMGTEQRPRNFKWSLAWHE